MKRVTTRRAAALHARWLRLALAAVALSPGIALAEPYLAVQQGYKCIVCHVNPTGGGERSLFGDVCAENVMPATTLPAGVPAWTGQVIQDLVRIGGDLRTDWSRTTQPHSPIQQQVGLEQVRLYADISVIPNKLGVYIDELIAPGAAQTMEAYARYGDTSNGYLKAGHFYVPFGWRLQDQSAFVRQVTGINMTAPDDGIELGLERPNWSGQLDATKGVANAGSSSGYQVTGQLVRVQTAWRFGAAAAFTHTLSGDRQAYGVFAGLRTGPVAWLGEADLVHQAGGAASTTGAANGTSGSNAGSAASTAIGAVRKVPLLGEMDWALHRGHNLKLTYEFYDPDLDVHNNQQTRWSAVYEYTPIPFLQARAGFRRYQGIPQSNAQNETLTFVEVHGFF
jgi:hypothetical protein